MLKNLKIAVQSRQDIQEMKDIAEQSLLKAASEHIGQKCETILEAQAHGIKFSYYTEKAEDGFNIIMTASDPLKECLVGNPHKIAVTILRGSVGGKLGIEVNVELFEGEPDEEGEDVYFQI
jgi:hypothetical protein